MNHGLFVFNESTNLIISNIIGKIITIDTILFDFCLVNSRVRM